MQGEHASIEASRVGAGGRLDLVLSLSPIHDDDGAVAAVSVTYEASGLVYVLAAPVSEVSA